MSPMTLLAQRNKEEINRYLGQNPLILGLLAIVIGLAIGGWGLFELSRGVAHGKYGHAVHGSHAKFLSIFRIVFGALCILFGIYKMLLG